MNDQDRITQLEAACAAMRERLEELLEVHEFIDDEDEHQTKATKKALRSDAGKSLLDRLQAVEAERDRYKAALQLIDRNCRYDVWCDYGKIVSQALQPAKER